MRITLFLPDISTLGGVEHLTLNMARLFSQTLGYEVTILDCFSKKGLPAYDIPPEIQMSSLKTAPYPASAFKRIAWYLGLVKPLEDWLHAHPCDVIIAEGGYLSAALALVKTPGVKRIGAEHVSPQSATVIHKLFRKFLYPKLDNFVVSTESYKRFYERSVPGTACIPYFLTSLPAERAMLDAKTVISVGRLTRQKGIDLLLKAWALTRAAHPDWKLIIYGEGGERQNLEIIRTDLGLETSVDLPGETKEMRAKLNEASFYVLPSRFEGLPMALIEAMASGLPSIAFDCPGPDTLIHNGTNGFLVPAGDISAFAKAAIRLMSDKNERLRLGAGAIQTSQNYSKEQIGEKWQSLLNSRSNS